MTKKIDFASLSLEEWRALKKQLGIKTVKKFKIKAKNAFNNAQYKGGKYTSTKGRVKRK